MTALSQDIRNAASRVRTHDDDVSMALADWLDYEAERFFNAYEAAEHLRHIVVNPREERIVLTLIESILKDGAE